MKKLKNTIADVREDLEPYGVNAFLSDEDILEKIEASDGEPTYLGRVYRVFVDDRWISGQFYILQLSFSAAVRISFLAPL